MKKILLLLLAATSSCLATGGGNDYLAHSTEGVTSISDSDVILLETSAGVLYKIPALGIKTYVTTAIPWSDLVSKPTTLSGYGITDPIVVTSGSYTNPSWIVSLPWSKLTSTPTTLSGYGITDPIVVTSGSYTNPSWIVSLPWSKLTSTPTTLSGYGITDPIVVTSGSYTNPSWIVSLPWSKLTSMPTSAASYGIVNGAALDTLAAASGTTGYVWTITGSGTAGYAAVPGSLSFTSPLVNTSGTVALTIGSSGGVEAWAANLDSFAAKTAPSGTVVGTTDTQTLTNKAIAASEINSGTLSVAQGGTGVATLTAYAPLFGGTTSTGAVQSGTVGTAGQVLTSNGSGALPTFQTTGGVWTNENGSFTAAGGGQYSLNALEAGAGFTVTLPTTGLYDCETVTVADLTGSGYGSSGWQSKPMTVSGTVRPFNGFGVGNVSTVTLNHNFQIAVFTYQSGQGAWTENTWWPSQVLTGTLASGAVTITAPAGVIGTSSIITATHMGTSATNAGALFVKSLSSGSVTIDSTNASDNDTISITIQ